MFVASNRQSAFGRRRRTQKEAAEQAAAEAIETIQTSVKITKADLTRLAEGIGVTDPAQSAQDGPETESEPLTPDQRREAILSHLEGRLFPDGLSIKEIAEASGFKETHIRNDLTRLKANGRVYAQRSDGRQRWYLA